MSIRSRIATFEARNQQLRKTVPAKNGEFLTDEDEEDEYINTHHHHHHRNNINNHKNNNNHHMMAPPEPRIVTPSSNSSVAGRFRSTNLQQQPHRNPRREEPNNAAASLPVQQQQQQQQVEEDRTLDELPRGVQRYQPLHQQYHQRQAQQRLQKQRQWKQQQQQQQQQQDAHPEQAPPRIRPPGGVEEEDDEDEQEPTTRNSRATGTQNNVHLPQRVRAAHHQRRLEQMRRHEDNQRRLHESQQQQQEQQQQGRYTPDATRKQEDSVTEANTQFTSNKTTTAQRLAKIQRMQRNRSLEKVRKNHQGARLEDFDDRPPSPEQVVQRDLSLQPSAADDEITLTSVRQIVGTNSAQSSSSRSSKNKRPTNHHAKTSRGNGSGGVTGNAGLTGGEGNGSSSGIGVYPDEMAYTDDQDWPEEKSDKVHRAPHNHRNSLRMSASSSSDDGGGGGGQREQVPAVTSQLTPDVASFFEESQRRFLHPDSPKAGDEENISQGSESFAQRKERERKEQVARDEAVKKAKAEMDGPFLKAEDVDYYQKSIDNPMAKTAAGVAVAATVGCVVLGPVGLLIGAATVGIGVGIMQIPPEQRKHMEYKATQTLRQVSDAAMSASESMSASCANTYQESGIADHVPDEVNNCCAAIVEAPTTDKSEVSVSVKPDRAKKGGAAPVDTYAVHDHDRIGEELQPQARLPPRRPGAACLREGTFTPVSLIYTLDPVDQPRAWLDVLASAETTHDEKMEALEEIMILAKDKSRARILVEEGILDSIMWTLGRYFEKLYGPQQDELQVWANPEITPEEARAAKLTANCCLQLGKAYCAAMHTDGDLMLMSLYERGTVPEERQLAQLLHEVPYHTRVTKTKDPTIVDPASEVFAVVQMSLPQAEEFAKSVKALAHGQTYHM